MNLKTLFTFFLLLFIILLTVAVTLIPEIIGQDMADWCATNLKPIFGEKYKYWLLGIVVAACVLLAFLTTEQGRALFSRSTESTDRPLTLTPEETQRNYATIRQYLLEKRYRPRQQQKLAGDQLFNLHVKPTKEGTSKEKADTFITLQGKPTGKETRQIFEESRRRLLVTGVPGAGKTSLLLHLAIELLETETESLAVLLNLATWSGGSFDDWLLEILPAELGVTKRYATEILQKGQLTLLLDGLDEVAKQHRASCLQAIGEYGRLGRDYVISTRKDEYKALEKDAPVWAQIAVQPLTDKQLLAQLDKADRRDFPEAPDLKAALQHDPLLLQVAETPFYLNCLQLLFRGGKTLSELKLYTDLEIEAISKIYAHHINNKLPVPKELQIGQAALHLEDNIVVRFVEQALAQPSKYGSPEQVRRWLAFLASRMKQRNKVVFELVDLQYDWWRWKKGEIVIINVTSKFVYWLFVSFFYCPMIIILFSLSGGIAYGFKIGLFWIVGVLALGIIGKVSKDLPSISTREKASYSWKYYFSHLRELRNFLTISITVICVISLFLKNINLLAGGICGMLTFSVFASFANMVRHNHSITFQIKHPLQRFKASAIALHFSILQHWLLRWQLYRAGVLPLRLVHFLNEMTARHLLETDGATWRFRHRILQEYFAGQWREG